MRYIDADKLKSEFDYKHIGMNKTTACVHHKNILEIINQQPTANVVNVVRCKDCKWFNPINNGDHGYCGTPFHGAEVYEDDYCSDGER